MLLGEMHDLARQIAERTVPWSLWIAAVRSAASAAGGFDERLEVLAAEEVLWPAGALSQPLPAGRSAEELLAVHLEQGEKRVKLLRWGTTESAPWQQRGVRELREDLRWRHWPPRWDTPTLREMTLRPVPQEDLTLVLSFRPAWLSEEDDAPSWLLYGALAHLGRNLYQDSRSEAWEAQFRLDLEGALARAITSSSAPLGLRW